TGGVTKRLFTFEDPVDPGLADWAAVYLNERLTGMGLGARMLVSKLADPTLGAVERGFLERLAPAFTELADTAEDTLYVAGPRPGVADRAGADGLRGGDRRGARRGRAAVQLRRGRLRRLLSRPPCRATTTRSSASPARRGRPTSRRRSAGWRASCIPTSTTTI